MDYQAFCQLEDKSGFLTGHLSSLVLLVHVLFLTLRMGNTEHTQSFSVDFCLTCCLLLVSYGFFYSSLPG